jgi:hypothetical protein
VSSTLQVANNFTCFIAGVCNILVYTFIALFCFCLKYLSALKIKFIKLKLFVSEKSI